MDISVSDGLRLSAQLIMTGRGCVIGQSGSGKSYLIGVITEELLRLKMPFCIIDTEGEYATLKESFSMLVVGGPEQDVPLDTDFEKLFSRSIEGSVPVVLDLSECVEKAEAAYAAITSLYKVEEKMRRPYLVMIEEADKFAPQVVRPRINAVEELSVRGRKRGIGLIVATQRPSNISKNVLSQCSYGFIGKLTIENDLSAISQLFSSRSTLEQIVNLETGEFIPFGVGTNSVVKVRQSESRHAGSTPIVSNQEHIESKKELSSMIAEFNRKPAIRRNAAKEGGEIDIESMPLHLTHAQAESYALKVSRKMFGIFGRQIESIDSIELKYIPLRLCKIRIPAGKRDFNEYVLLLDNNSNILQPKNQIKVIENSIKKTKLTRLEGEILSCARDLKFISFDELEGERIATRTAIEKAARGLEEKGFAHVKNGSLHISTFTGLLSNAAPASEHIRVKESQILGASKPAGELKRLISAMYPSASLLEMEELYLPLYIITLKHGNHVRVFKIDGVFGKETAMPE